MNLESLRKYCKTLPGATVDIKWGADECHCVGGRMFTVFGLAKLTRRERDQVAVGKKK